MEQFQVQTKDGITWHVEAVRHRGPQAEYIALIPSGEGDCQSLLQVALLLSDRYAYNVITFDMPGMSRTTAPESAYTKVTPQRYASQISNLLKELNIKQTSTFGCSSGGVTALALQAYHSDQIKCSVVHECPFGTFPAIEQLVHSKDEEISQFCEKIFLDFFIEEANDGKQKWNALGTEYHARLYKNYVTWIRGLVGTFPEGGQKMAGDKTLLQKRPVFWTVGGLNEDMAIWQANFDVAKAAGLEVNTTALQSKHFPSVTVPEQLAGWIDRCVKSAS